MVTAEKILIIIDWIEMFVFTKVLPFSLLILGIVLLKSAFHKSETQEQLLIRTSKANLNGIVFGLKKSKLVCSKTEYEGHVAVFGGSGLGKTSALLIPTLNAWKGTSLIVDISGDIYRNTRMKNKLLFNPDLENSVPYSIFTPIDELENVEDQNEALEKLAFLLMPENIKGSEASSFLRMKEERS